MTDKKIPLLRGVIQALTGTGLVISGICLIRGCLGIYRAGSFSPQAVAEAFSPIAPVVFLSLGLVAVSFLVRLLLPPKKEKAAPAPVEMRLARQLQRCDLSDCDPGLAKQIQAQQHKRRQIILARSVLMLLLSLVFLHYALNPDNFHQSQINASMVDAMRVLLPCLLSALAASLVAGFFTRRTMEAELTLCKQAPSRKAVPAAGAKRNNVRSVVLVLALALLVYGYFTGGTADVLTKAVNICTECVGLG